MRLPLENVSLGLKDCIGYSAEFSSRHIEKYVPISFETLTTQAPYHFTNPELKEALLRETNHYMDRSLYHLGIGKSLISRGCPTWGLVSFYYSSFFAAQAAIRLRGRAFVRIDYEPEVMRAPTYYLEVLNFVQNKFQIRKAAGGVSEHVRVWKTFFDLYNGLALTHPDFAAFSTVTEETDPELRLAEMHRRHLINYVPGFGYFEMGPEKAFSELLKRVNANVFLDQSQTLADDDAQLELRAFLRLKLCFFILKMVVNQRGSYAAHHADKNRLRRKWLESTGCPAFLKKPLVELLQ